MPGSRKADAQRALGFPVATPAAAWTRVAALDLDAYARGRNHIDGPVSGLSPYLTHGLLSIPGLVSGLCERGPLPVRHRFVFELAWREYFRHVWQHRGAGILKSLRPGLLAEAVYAGELPADIRTASTGVPVVDTAVRALYRSGTLHNHARMWLASYVVHLRKVHWRVGADWLYGHLLDGDLASNHLSWQWVAGTGSHKPYLFNADNVARHAPPDWHSPGSPVDVGYAALDRIARDPDAVAVGSSPGRSPPAPGSPAEPVPRVRRPAAAPVEPGLLHEPPPWLGVVPPDRAAVAGRDVWLVHPWNLGEVPAGLPADTVVVGLCVADFHRAWPWRGARWDFVGARMAALAPVRWWGDSVAIGRALAAARRVYTVDDPHLAPWLVWWAECREAPRLFPRVDPRCDSFSQWWARVTRGLDRAQDLLIAPGARAA